MGDHNRRNDGLGDGRDFWLWFAIAVALAGVAAFWLIFHFPGQ